MKYGLLSRFEPRVLCRDVRDTGNRFRLPNMRTALNKICVSKLAHDLHVLFNNEIIDSIKSEIICICVCFPVMRASVAPHSVNRVSHIRPA